MGESFWLAFAGIAVWPVAAVVLVLIVLLFVRPEHRAEGLRALAEVVRAARGTAEQGPHSDLVPERQVTRGEVAPADPEDSQEVPRPAPVSAPTG